VRDETMPEGPEHRPAEAGSSVRIDAPRRVVYDRLIDPKTYPDWLVGAKDIRAIDGEWPKPGSRFHHRVGLGPFTIDDATEVVSTSPPDELLLRAHVGPLGSALVRFRLVGSDPTVVFFDEAPDSGVLRRVGTTIARVGLKASVWGRNQLSLERLRAGVELQHHR
jgi:uncharacterized protein YndB with AHSA1/START domain